MVYRKGKEHSNRNINAEEAPLVLLIRADERCFLSFLWMHCLFCILHKTTGGQGKGGEKGVFKAAVMWYNGGAYASPYVIRLGIKCGKANVP